MQCSTLATIANYIHFQRIPKLLLGTLKDNLFLERGGDLPGAYRRLDTVPSILVQLTVFERGAIVEYLELCKTVFQVTL